MAPDRNRRRIPDATVSRLPVYLRLLGEQSAEGVDNISSERLAELQAHAALTDTGLHQRGERGHDGRLIGLPRLLSPSDGVSEAVGHAGQRLQLFFQGQAQQIFQREIGRAHV